MIRKSTKIAIIAVAVLMVGLLAWTLRPNQQESYTDETVDVDELIQEVPEYYAQETGVNSNKVKDYVVEPQNADDVWSPGEYPALAQSIANNFYDLKPLLDVDGKPIFDVVDFKKIVDGWYVARIQYQGGNGFGSWVVLKEYRPTSNRTWAVLGPSTSFDVTDFYEWEIPLEVYYSYNKV
jgi:hypothetical protein